MDVMTRTAYYMIECRAEVCAFGDVHRVWYIEPLELFSTDETWTRRLPTDRVVEPVWKDKEGTRLLQVTAIDFYGSTYYMNSYGAIYFKDIPKYARYLDGSPANESTPAGEPLDGS